jgi:anti-anti-sigma factor
MRRGNAEAGGRAWGFNVPLVSARGAPSARSRLEPDNADTAAKRVGLAAFDIAIKATGPEELVVRLSGELDLVSRAGVVEHATKAIGELPALERLVVDLARVTFCDSTGLGALLDIGRLASDKGAVIVLRDVPPAVSRLLDLAGVNDVLTRE